MGVVVGSLIGTVTGLLLAPRSGKETRHILKKSADGLPDLVEDLAATLQQQSGLLSESAQRNWQETLDRLRSAIADGVEASQSSEIQPVQKQDNLPSHPLDS
ncbi:MAG: YtxH domain-containing protein [Microcystaceae cyanobacterium]